MEFPSGISASLQFAILVILVCERIAIMARFMISEFFVVKWLRGEFKSGLFYQLHFTAYSYVVANKYSASLQSCIPCQSKIFTV